jgi:ABC-type transport system involved in cytochrome c biogenesis permease component
MTALPIVQRELLVSARRRLTFWARIFAASIGFALVFFVLGADPNPSAAGALGAKLFRSLSTIAFWTCLFGGAVVTADCFSVEKRDGTLGLLFLTDLKGYDVVLGKFMAKSLIAVLCLLAIIPMLAIPILLGGVLATQFWHMTAVLLNTLFVSLCIGMLVSVISREPRNAIALAAFTIFLWLVVPAIVGSALPPTMRWTWLVHPLTPLQSILAPGARITFGWSSAAFLVQHSVGWLCLWLASRRAATSWHEQRPPPAWQDQFQSALRGDSPTRLALRRALLPINAVLWFESRDRVKRAALFGLFVMLAFGGWLLNRSRAFHWADMPCAISTVIFLHVFLKLLLTFDASTRLIEARRDGALALVLSTRMSVEDVLRGELLAAKRLFGPSVLLLLAFDVVWFVGVAAYERRPGYADAALAIVLCWAAILIANGTAILLRAFYLSLHAKRPYHAAFRAYLEVVIAPFLWFGFYLLGRDKSGGVIEAVGVFALLNLVNTLFFMHGSWQRLKQEFRDAIMEAPPPPVKDYGEDYALLN